MRVSRNLFLLIVGFRGDKAVRTAFRAVPLNFEAGSAKIKSRRRTALKASASRQ